MSDNVTPEVESQDQTPETTTEDTLLSLKKQVADGYVADIRKKTGWLASVIIGEGKVLTDYLITEDPSVGVSKNPKENIVVETAGLNALGSLLTGLDKQTFDLDGQKYTIKDYLVKLKEKIKTSNKSDLDQQLALLASESAAPGSSSSQAPATPTNPETSTIEYQDPFADKLKDLQISSGFGKRKHPVTGLPNNHKGIDIPAPEGTPIYPIEAGTVIENKWTVSSGYTLKIRSNDGRIFSYLHMKEKSTFRKDAQVTTKDIIGHIGTTGTSTGPHLHLAEQKDGKFVNPIKDPQITPVFEDYKNYDTLATSDIVTEDDMARAA